MSESSIFTSTHWRSGSATRSVLVLEDGSRSELVCRLMNGEGNQMTSTLSEAEAVEFLAPIAPQLLLSGVASPFSFLESLLEGIGPPADDTFLVIIATGPRALSVTRRAGEVPFSAPAAQVES